MKYLKENGVLYLHWVDEISIPPGNRLFTYEWVHIPSRTRGLKKVIVLGTEKDMQTLLSRWNAVSNDWFYKLASP